MDNKYCEICGKELLKMFTGSYNSKTGEKIFISHCEDLCHPYCIMKRVKIGWLEWIVHGFKDKWKTVCCDKIIYVNDDSGYKILE
jgi:hypothetical protein